MNVIPLDPFQLTIHDRFLTVCAYVASPDKPRSAQRFFGILCRDGGEHHVDRNTCAPPQSVLESIKREFLEPTLSLTRHQISAKCFVNEVDVKPRDLLQ